MGRLAYILPLNGHTLPCLAPAVGPLAIELIT
jgi:hypothetical protein